MVILSMTGSGGGTGSLLQETKRVLRMRMMTDICVFRFIAG
jgi:hypothetical protein